MQVFCILRTKVLYISGRLTSHVTVESATSGLYETELAIGKEGISLTAPDGATGLIEPRRIKDVRILERGASGVTLRISIAKGEHLDQTDHMDLTMRGSKLAQVSQGTPGQVVVGIGIWPKSDSLQSPPGAKDQLTAISWLIAQVCTPAVKRSFGVKEDSIAQPKQPPRHPGLAPGDRVEVQTDGDRRGTLVLFGDHIEYRDDGMGSGGGRAPYGPNPDNNFTLACAQILDVKAYGIRPTIFGSFDVTITAGRKKFHIPSTKSSAVAESIRQACGINTLQKH